MSKTINDFKKSDMISSLQVGMSILEIISNEKRPLKYSEVLELSGMSKSNLYKYLNTLTALQMLYRNPSTGAYAIGTKIIEYGMSAVNDTDIAEFIAPFMTDIRKEWNETVYLGTFNHDGPMIIKMLNSSRPFNIAAQIGTVLPIQSAAGKLFMTFKNDYFELWKKEHEDEMDADTIASLLDEAERQEIHTNKIAFAAETLLSSNASMAVPILNYDQDLIATVIIVGFKETIPQSPDDAMAAYLIEKGKEISAIFGGSSN